MKIDYFQAKKNKLIVIEGLVCCRVFLGLPCRWQQSGAINGFLGLIIILYSFYRFNSF